MRQNKFGNFFLFIVDNLIWLLVLIALVAFSLLSNKFLTPFNMVNTLWRVAALGLLVVGQSFTLITGNFDLSAESTMGLAAMVGAMLLATTKNGGLGMQANPLIAIGSMLLVGVLVGVINGFLITKLKMNNFIVTVAMLMILRGVIYAINPGKSTSFLPEAFDWLGGGTLVRLIQANGKPLVIPVAAAFVLLSFLIAHIITRYRRFGRNMYAIGSNRAAAEATGINSARIIMAVYIISGLCAALAGLLDAGRMDSATPRTGAGLIFPVQAAAVIGGISLFGGRGTMVGALGGLLLWGIMDSGLNIMKVSPFWIEVARGGLLLFAMLLDALKVRYLQRAAIQKALANNPIGLQDQTI